MSNTDFFWSAFSRNRPEYGPEKTPYLGHFYAVVPGHSFVSNKTISALIDMDLLLMMEMLAKTTHAPNLVTKSKDFSVELVKSLIDLKNS